MQIEWRLKGFDDLTLHELYTILQLRNEVFVVEQHCAFQDADNNDQFSYHVMGWQNNRLIAYTRLVPPDTVYKESSIGRVATSHHVRNTGIGKLLMQVSINRLYYLFGDLPIKIGAQLYLEKFYESFGFRQISSPYLEDGIEHIYMMKEPEGV